MSSSLKLQKLLIQKLSEKYSLNLRDLKKAFSNFDKDQNGLLDLTEVERGIQQYLAGVSSEAISELVALYDVNGDGSISYDEFLAILRNPKEIEEREQLAMTPRYDDDDIGDDFELYSDNEVPPLPAVDYEYYNDRRVSDDERERFR
jgi:Ca2+-binding EF-hand superfamily protein